MPTKAVNYQQTRKMLARGNSLEGYFSMKESEGSREEELLVLTTGSRVSNSVAAAACGAEGTARNWISDCTYAGSSIVIIYLIADAAGELDYYF